MSFILDALKKADAERNLGTLPGIHTSPIAGAPAPPVSGLRRHAPAMALVGCVILLAAAALLYRNGARQQPTPVQSVATSTPSRPGADVAAPATPSPDAPSAQAQVTQLPQHAETTETVRLKLARTATPASSAGSAATPDDLPTPPPIPQTARVHKESSPGARTTPTATPAPAKAPSVATPDPAVMTLSELPPNIQHELPSLAISGTMYSGNPADRVLLIDKRMLHEGDEIAPGLVLDGVLPKGARLRYKGYVFRVNH